MHNWLSNWLGNVLKNYLLSRKYANSNSMLTKNNAKIFQKKKQLHNCLQIAIISYSHQKAGSFMKMLWK